MGTPNIIITLLHYKIFEHNIIFLSDSVRIFIHSGTSTGWCEWPPRRGECRRLVRNGRTRMGSFLGCQAVHGRQPFRYESELSFTPYFIISFRDDSIIPFPGCFENCIFPA